MRFLVCFSTLFFLIACANALTCWTCENAKSNEDCMTKGQSRLCRLNENACENVVRRGSFGMKLTKRCKQALACDNNYIQNPRVAWFPSQCNTNAPSSVCRCCCGTDLCNRDDLGCSTPPTTTEATTRAQPSPTPPMSCDPPQNPINGVFDCSPSEPISDNRFVLGTVCSYQCNEGYTLDGPNSTTCEVVSNLAFPVFSTRPPFCRPPPTCYPPLDPINGETTCREDPNDLGLYVLGSQCTYRCNEGYFFDENAITTTSCQRLQSNELIATFDPAPPFCQIIPPTCTEPSHPGNGRVFCDFPADINGEYALGSICSFSCNDGFILEGSYFTRCRLDQSSFSASFIPESTTCRPQPTCDPPQSPLNGRIECRTPSLPNGKFALGTECEYFCNSGFSSGNAALLTECEYLPDSTTFAEFAPGPPLCVEERPRCEEQGDISKGTVDCSNENLVGSFCLFSCDEGYTHFPSSHTSSICRDDQTWSRDKPCCMRSCPPRAFMDLVIVLDSSSSIGSNNWQTMLNFTNTFINNFDIDNDAARFGVFRYNSVVDINSQIHLSQFADDKAGLMAAVSTIPYNGEGTFTGNALQYARTTAFTLQNGARTIAPKILLVITDGNAQDRTTLYEEAEELRNEGIATFAIGIVSETAGLDVQELLVITGQASRILIPDNGFSGLDKKLAQILGGNICTARSCQQ